METPGPAAPAALRPDRAVDVAGVTDDEWRALNQVARDLAGKYPQVPAGEVRALVEASAAGFTHARIRTFVPLLVAREVDALLRAGPRT